MDIENSDEKLKELQEELIHVENVLLVTYAGLLGFSSACALAVLSEDKHTYFILAAFLFFIIAIFCFGLMVLGKIFVLHKGNGLHIGHVIIQEESASIKAGIGGIALIAGLALYATKISFWCFFFVLIGAILAFRSHAKFRKNLNGMGDARTILKRIQKENQSGHHN